MSEREISTELHRIVTTCVIYRAREGEDGTRYLVTKRSPHKKAFPGMWTVPGGGLTTDDYTNTEPNEGGVWYGSLLATLHREIKEEVGVAIGQPKFLVDMTFLREDCPVLILSFYAPYEGGEVVLDNDAVEYRWVTIIEAEEIGLIPGILGELTMVQQLLSGWDPENVIHR